MDVYRSGGRAIRSRDHVMGIQQNLMAAPTPSGGGGTNFSLTTGNNTFGGGGWSTPPCMLGTYGSVTPPAPVIGGITICGISDIFSEMYLYLAGSQVGSTAWIQFTINGKTYTRAGSVTPAGTIDGGGTYWKWSLAAGLAIGSVYPVVVT